ARIRSGSTRCASTPPSCSATPRSRTRACTSISSRATTSRTVAMSERNDVSIAAREALREEKGLLDRKAVDALVSRYEHDIGPMNGAKVVARAWVDPAFKRRLLDDATRA